MTFAPVNGLEMYYETHGVGGTPLVLLHGAMSAAETSFGALLPGLAKTRRVIVVERQGHGRTADVDRPFTVGQMADDTVALLDHLGLDQVDLFGYSMGAMIALDVAIRRPERIRRLVLASVSYQLSGVHPGVLDGIDAITPEMMSGTPFEAEYLRLSPHPQRFPTFVAKTLELDRNLPEFDPEAIRQLNAPTLLVYGDSDIVTPEHAVEMFRLLGGGVMGDAGGLPQSQLAVLPGTSHIGVATRADLLLAIIPRFLDGPGAPD